MTPGYISGSRDWRSMDNRPATIASVFLDRLTVLLRERYHQGFAKGDGEILRAQIRHLGARVAMESYAEPSVGVALAEYAFLTVVIQFPDGELRLCDLK